MLGQSNFARGLHRDYDKGALGETGEHIHGEEHMEQTVVEEIAVLFEDA